uniref:Reverse transcriptase domain-containing protein n=1 Tax=Tanacetum cinerariifolium TaxID=118510 RepID=A0A6L2P1N6_TANCI|nr:reverse transcriptase domain-containing protein [Tanacetum cinerariifolium]
MELETTQTSTTTKLPMLKQENGKSFKPVAQTTTKNAGTSTILITGLVTTEEKVRKKNDVKAGSMLLMALPNEHLMTFNQYNDAKNLFAAIEAQFGGNEATKKTQKTLLKQMYKSAFGVEYLCCGDKSDLDTMSIDDLYNNFKIVEQEVKRIASSNSSSQNMAFMSSPSINITKEVYTAYGVSTANTQSSTASTQVSTAGSQIITANLRDASVYAFLATQSNGSQLVHKDLEQFHKDNLEEMDLKWQLALLSMRAKSGVLQLPQDGTFFKRVQRVRNQDSRNRYQDNSRRTVNVEETPSKAMVAINGVGFDWSYIAEDEVPTNMAFSESKVKTINGEEQIQALVDKKKVIIIKTSVRSDLYLEDARDTECLPTATIFEQLTLMGVLALETTKVNQALEIGSLKRRVKWLEKKHSKKTHKLKILYKIGSSTRMESSQDAGLGDQEDGRNDQDMFDTSIFDDEEAVAEKEVSITDPVPTASETSKPKAKGIVIHEPSETPTPTLTPTPTPTPTPIDSSQQPSKAKDKGKAKMIEPEKPLKKNKKAIEGSEKTAEGRSKRAADKLEQEDAKRLQVDYEVEMAYDLLRLIRRQISEGYLQNLLPTILAQVGNQGSNQRNLRIQNSDTDNDNIQGNVRNVIVNNDQRGCTYKEFLACNLKEYDGKGGAIVYTYWIKKMESIQEMSGVRKNKRFQELARLVPHLVTSKNKRIKRYIYSLALQIRGMVAATKPEIIQRAIQKVKTLINKAVRNGSLKRNPKKRGNNREPDRDRNVRDENKRTRTGNAFAKTTNSVRREYNGTTLSVVAPKIVNPMNVRNPTPAPRACYECEGTDHFKAACPSKANVVADALSRKERIKPRRIRAINMTLQLNIKDKILAAQKDQPEIPEWKWKRIAIDFVKKLQRTSSGHDTIWVIMDKLTKSAHFLSMREDYEIDRLARLYLNEYVVRHGMPISIISDHDSRFTLRFWQSMQEAFGTRLDMSTAYHPQTDSQTYKLRLPEGLNGVHDMLHVSNLKKCLADPTLQVPLDDIQINAKLSFVEEPVEILEFEFKKLK